MAPIDVVNVSGDGEGGEGRKNARHIIIPFRFRSLDRSSPSHHPHHSPRSPHPHPSSPSFLLLLGLVLHVHINIVLPLALILPAGAGAGAGGGRGVPGRVFGRAGGLAPLPPGRLELVLDVLGDSGSRAVVFACRLLGFHVLLPPLGEKHGLELILLADAISVRRHDALRGCLGSCALQKKATKPREIWGGHDDGGVTTDATATRLKERRQVRSEEGVTIEH
eukprot:2967272-Pyramimonas_sp.AAC.1